MEKIIHNTIKEKYEAFQKEVNACSTLQEIWKSQKVQVAKKELRSEIQKIISQWCRTDRKKIIPVYISLKPKITKGGMCFRNRSLVIFPIRIPYYSSPTFTVRSYEEVLKTVRHEYAHHIDFEARHGNKFRENLKMLERRIK